MTDDQGNGGGNGGSAEAAPDMPDEEAKNRREGALEKLKKALAAREVPVPRLEGYGLAKARKILSLVGIPAEVVRLRFSEDDRERGLVTGQRPPPGEQLDVTDEDARIEIKAADQSVARFLPSIYQRSDLTGRSFVRDLLWVFQHIFNETEEKLDGLERYFDPFECPPDFLAYIGSWVALAVEEDWPETKKRNLIKKAVELYHLRGTPRGLRVYLRIFTGVDPIIHENQWPFDGVVEGVSSTCGVDTVLMHFVDRAHAFVVELPLPITDVDVPTIMKIHRIIEQEKPAHTDYYLVFRAPEEKEIDTGLTVGVTSTIGVDTWVTGADAEAYFPLEDQEGGGMTTAEPEE